MSKTSIANLVITHLGISEDISNMEEENSINARAIRRVYDLCRKSVLQDNDWTFARKEAVLALISSDPVTEYSYSYRYPEDCLSIKRIKSGLVFDNKCTSIPYVLRGDEEKKIIYTNEYQASIVYTVDLENTELFSTKMELALSYLIASMIAPQVTGGDPTNLEGRCLAKYQSMLSKAGAQNMNEERPVNLPPNKYRDSRY